MENDKYTLIIQNNATKETFVFDGLDDGSTNHLYHRFELQIDAPEGEYTYCVFRNMRDDVSYTYKVPLKETILDTEDGQVVLKDLQPSTGLLRIGEKVESAYVYDLPKEKDNNSTIYYYE